MDKGITIKVNGIPEALEKLKKYQFKKKEMVKKELVIGGYKIEGLAKEMAPVSPGGGRLMSSIVTDLSDITFLVVKVGSDVEYAPYQEFGTRYMAPQSYLFPAFFAYENDIVKAIGRVLKKDIGIG